MRISSRLLPSAPYRRYLAGSCRRVISDASDEVGRTIESVLGDLGLQLATRPLTAWAFDPVQMGLELSKRRLPGEAPACIELAERHGMLRRTAEHLVVPTEPDEMLWLAARRTVETKDAAGLMDERLRGALADVFALVVAEQPDADSGRGMAAYLAERDGPFEATLALSARLVTAAGAWGGALDAELRGRLLPLAFEWTSAPGQAPHREAGAALLATEVTGDHEGAHSFADEVREAAAERLDQLLEWLDDPDLADVEDVFLVALEDTLTPLVAGSSDDPEALSELARGLSRYAGRVGLVLGRVRPAGPRTDELLVRLAQQAGDCGDTGALAMLSAIDEPRDVPASVLHEALTLALKSPDDETLAMRARAACEAVADWPECSELTAHLLGRIVLAPVPFQLRTAGAAALASQPVWRESMLRVVTAGLESELHSSDPATQAGVVGAGLWLGSANPDVVMAAVRLVQEGWPPELLAPALAQALRRQPDLVDPLVALGQRPGSARTPLLLLLGGLVDAAQQDHALGPYLTVPPLTSGVRVGLTTVLLDVVQSTDDPAPAGAAAVLACWLSRGQEELASLMFDLRHDAGRGALHGWLNVALGACGVADARVQALLASDAATAEPELAESAGIGLAALFDTASQIDGEALDPHGADIARRLAGDGAEADSLRTALITLSALPLG